MSLFDLYDQAANTATVQVAVKTVLEQLPRVAPQLATIVPTTEDKVKLEKTEVRAMGKGQFKAIGATPPVWAPRILHTEEAIELVQLAEMTPIDEGLFRRLQSKEKEIQLRAGADVLAIGQGLQLRNERLSDWMILTAALTGQLPINFSDEPGQGIVLDYGYDPTHLPTVTTSWDNLTTATPITDMRAFQDLLADEAGDWGIHFWMTSKVWDYILYSKQAKDYLTPTDRTLYIPTPEDIKKLLREPDRVQIHITDAGYRDESAGYGRKRSQHTKWLPDTGLLVTTENPFEGRPLIEQFDGMVMVQTDWNDAELRQGAQSEVKIRENTHFWHQTSTRIPRVNRPECIISATVKF